MVQPMGGLPYATDITAASVAQSSSQSTTSSSSSSTTGESAFEQQLATAIQQVVQQYGNGSQYDINIQTGQGTDGTGFTITVNDDGAESTGSTATTSTATSSTAAAATSTTGSSAASTASTASTSTTTIPAAELANMTPADAYWAEQPAAVQALRYMPTDERTTYAEQLASEGYTIDVPIMVDGLDPLATMITREIDGYTWVPSGLQANIPAGPGIDMPGVPAYNPNDPPAGSILVSTAFALGTNMQDPVVSQQDMQTYVLDQAGASSSTATAT